MGRQAPRERERSGNIFLQGLQEKAGELRMQARLNEKPRLDSQAGFRFLVGVFVSPFGDEPNEYGPDERRQ